MALKSGKVNPLNALRLRQTSFPAHHFYYTSLVKYSPVRMTLIENWIDQNLNGRYYIGQSLDLIDNTFVYTTKIGFEQDKELSFFKLACPHLS